MNTKHDFSLLVVEDSPLINNALCAHLKKFSLPSFEVHSALSLSEAREKILNNRLDFIILDLELPDGTGEELIGFIASLELEVVPKVIVLTGSIDKTRREKLFLFGIIDYLSKDNPINFLANEVKKSITQYIAHQDVKVLVVDDSKLFADYVTALLKNQNYTVSTCLNSTQVYDILKNNKINLLITDLEMPEMDGIQLLRKIRQDDEFIDLPIIGVSGTSNQDLISRLLKSGANDFLSKPFTTETLLLKVDVTVSLYKKQRKLSELNEYLEYTIKKKVEEVREKDQLLELGNRHAQMGQMIGALTHQWKQPLHGISLAGEYIKQLSSSNDEVLETLNSIQEQVDFLSDTIDSFKYFFKPIEDLEQFSVVKSFQDVLKLLGDTYSDMEIKLKGDENLFVSGRSNEFNQVVINLLNNAQDAFKELKVTDQRVDIDISASANTVTITFTDNAGGIPPKIIDTVFDQYVSTKSTNGTGIGLHMSRSIIKKMGGDIFVKNTENGACFTITMPLAEKGAIK